MPIPWSDNLSVNVKEIDNQHKFFLSLLNDLYKTISSPNNKKILPEILLQLTDYAQLHFATEEKYFDQFNYEFSDEHKKEHQKLLTNVLKINEKYKSEGENILMELLDFLENWLVNHLSTQDKKYTKCFNEHGLF